jgi:hypothetical protein
MFGLYSKGLRAGRTAGKVCEDEWQSGLPVGEGKAKRAAHQWRESDAVRDVAAPFIRDTHTRECLPAVGCIAYTISR